MNRVAAVVVTYNSKPEIGACLDALEGQAAEVIVVDNASADGTPTEVRSRPWVRLIENPVNVGFAAAVNQGVAAASVPFILLMNPDAHLLSSLEPLIEACARHGIAAGRLTGEDGATQEGFTVRRFPTWATLAFESLGWNKLWPGNPVNRRYRYLGRDLTVAGPADQPAGAFLMFQREIFNRLGGLDEAFAPVWFEDVDFLKRASDIGIRAFFVPEVAAYHSGGHSVNRVTRECRARFWYASLLRYAAKHFSTLQFQAVCTSVACGCLIRYVTGTFLKQHETSPWTQIAGLAFRCLRQGRFDSGSVAEMPSSRTSAQAVASHSAQR